MKHLLVILMLLCASSAFAQDVIVKKDGSTVVCRVVELTSSEIIYKKWTDINGSNYVMNRNDASAINYESGKKIDLSGMNNLYRPGNQSNGVANANDVALLRMDKYNPARKAKRLKLTGWIGGGVFMAGALIYYFTYPYDEDTPYIVGGSLIGAGAIWTTCFLMASNHQKNKVQRLGISSIYQQGIDLGGGKKLATGIDLIRDKASHCSTLGLGLRYNL